MPDCPWGHAIRGRCTLAEGHGGDHVFASDAPAPPLSERASGALRRVAGMLDAAFHAYQDARDVASEEGAPLPTLVDEQIVASLVQADCLVRTQASLRAVREARRITRPKLGLVSRSSGADGDHR